MRLEMERGNAVIIVLVTVALFAALIVTFTRSGEQGTGNLSTQQARIAAQDIISSAQAFAQAVDRVRAKGCSENQISFEADGNTGYVNPNTTDDKCKVFSPQGGQISYQPPRSGLLDSSYSAQTSYGEWLYTGSNFVNKIGVDTFGAGNELAVLLLYLPLEVCLQINNMVGITNVGGQPPYEGNDVALTKFVGLYTNSPGGLWQSASGQYSACLRASQTIPVANSYLFYHVLLAR